jgi:glucose/mannose-6-phosphate isomerase
MNLDDLEHFREIDAAQLILQIDTLPEKLTQAWELAQTLPLPTLPPAIQQVIFLASGTGAIAADLVIAAFGSISKMPLACANKLNGTVPSVWLVTVGAGELHFPGGERWRIPDFALERTAFADYLAFILALSARFGWIDDPAELIRTAAETLVNRREIFGIHSPVVKNPAKRLGGQMIGRIPVVFGGGVMSPVARRWKAQINENAKSWAQAEDVMEAVENAAAGVMHPPPLMTRVHCSFLLPPPADVELMHKIEALHDIYLQEGVAVDKIKSRGDNALTQALAAIQFGDYVSYYVAMAYEVDPTPTPSLDELREKLASRNVNSSIP